MPPFVLPLLLGAVILFGMLRGYSLYKTITTDRRATRSYERVIEEREKIAEEKRKSDPSIVLTPKPRGTFPRDARV